MSIENHGDLEIALSPHGTPWLGANAPFVVRNQTTQLQYVGIRAVFLPPTERDFIRIGPGETVSDSYDIAPQYAIEEPGLYDVALRSPLIEARIGGVDLILQHNCGITSAKLDQVHQPQQLKQPLT